MAKRKATTVDKTVYDLTPGWYVVRPNQTLLKGIDGFPKCFKGKNSALDAACYVSDGAVGVGVFYVPNNFAWGE